MAQTENTQQSKSEATTRSVGVQRLVSVRTKSGRAWNGAARDAGTVTHAVPDAAYPSWDSALCGAKPGARGNGWQVPEPAGTEITCEKCRKRLAH
jgi:hypothetical protein